MCTNYRAPGEEAGLSELKINNFRDLYRWTPWKPEIYQDYDAPIVASVDGEFRPLIAGFGFWPRALQKANVEKAEEQGRKPPIIRSTLNVRDDNIGKSPLYAPAWRAGRRCLIPAKWIYEPNWETGSTSGTGSDSPAGGRSASLASGGRCSIRTAPKGTRWQWSR